ncbi:MAG: MATE family efflux transporter [Clostridia bacterium]|nr:MATE family efflux transporter [Clostridia bacterium]
MHHTSVKGRIDFTEGKLLKKVLFFAIPMVLSTYLQLLFNVADMAVVGRFAGTVYQAAVGSTSSAIHLITNLVIGCSVGANVAMATAFGAKDEEGQSRVVHTSMALSVVSGILVMIVGLAVTKPLLVALHTPKEVLPYAVTYMQIYFLGVPANSIYNFGASLFRGIGETKKPLFYLFVSGVINIGINIVTVVFFDMHVVGVALGTIISQYVAAVWVTIDLMKEKSAAKYSLKKTRFYKKELLEVLRLGVPTGINSSLFSVANILIQSTINSYGDIVIAGTAVGVQVDSFIDGLNGSFGRVVVTIVGQNIGAKKPERVKRTLVDGLGLCWAFQLVLIGVIAFFGQYIYSLFNADPEVIAQAMIRRRYTSFFYMLAATMEIFSATLRGMGYSLFPMFINIFFTCVFRVVWVLAIYPLFPRVEMVYVAYPITWTLSSIAQIVVCLLVYRKKYGKRREKTELQNGEIASQ